MSVKFKKFMLSFITVVSVIVTVIAAGSMVMRFYVAPKLGIAGNNLPTGKDVMSFTKYMMSPQVVDNLKNFNKDAAKEVLGALIELEGELEEPLEGEGVEPQAGGMWDEKITGPIIDSKKLPLKKEEIKEAIKESGINVTKKQQSAFDRIMAAASKQEIMAGMAILAKVDLAKVNSLYQANKKAELKKYLKTVLTSAEISKALSLYKKYKHLL